MSDVSTTPRHLALNLLMWSFTKRLLTFSLKRSQVSKHTGSGFLENSLDDVLLEVHFLFMQNERRWEARGLENFHPDRKLCRVLRVKWDEDIAEDIHVDTRCDAGDAHHASFHNFFSLHQNDVRHVGVGPRFLDKRRKEQRRLFEGSRLGECDAFQSCGGKSG